MPQKDENEFLPYLIIVGAFCFLLSQTWLKWGNPIIDTGRELWLPEELLKGKILYKDIVSFYGFLPAYFMTGLYKIFGSSINTLVYAGIGITLVLSFTLFKITRFFMDQVFSTLVVINFLFVFAFGRYTTSGIFNFILPYGFASTLFIALTALALYFFLKFIFYGNEKNVIAWSSFLALAFLCRPETALTIWPAFALTLFLSTGNLQKNSYAKPILYAVSPIIAASLCYGLFFITTGTFAGFKEMFTKCIMTNTVNPLAKQWSGLDNITYSLSQIFSSFFLQVSVITGLAAICRIVNLSRADKPATKAIIPILAAFLFFMIIKQASLYGLQYRCLTLILFLGSFAYLAQSLANSKSSRNVGLLTLFSLSFLIIFRIFLAPTPYQYGFFLLTIPLICYYIFFADILKTILEKHLKINEGSLATATACFFILMITPYWEHSAGHYKNHNKLITTAKGQIYCDNTTQTNNFWKTVNYLKTKTPQNSTLAVFPEGIGINFFTGLSYPLQPTSLLPMDIKLFGENNLLDKIKTAKIDYIVIMTRDTSESGATAFGVDYAKKIQKWVDANYVIIKQFGAKPFTSDTAGAIILKKKS